VRVERLVADEGQAIDASHKCPSENILNHVNRL
jgi:hypothetical protein